MSELTVAVDRLRVAMAQANRTIIRLGGKPLPYPEWLRLPVPVYRFVYHW